MRGGGQPLDGEPAANELSGVVHGSAVQARSIEGGVHFTIAPPASARMPLPAQLPVAAAHFTGRAQELAALRRAAEEYDPVRRLAMVVISGPGGAGKSSLATRLLHGVSGRYAGGALYTDLRGHSLDNAIAPSEVLTGFLAALGTPPDRIPVSLEDQAKLYRSLTSERRMLVLLDNAATAAQVRALLPGPGPGPGPGSMSGPGSGPGPDDQQPGLPSLVAVTTRWRIAGLAMDGARFVELGPLDDESGAELLRRMIGADRTTAEAEAIRSVVRLCGGLPLAICAAGARRAARPRWPVTRLAAELASEQDRLAAFTVKGDLSVRATFDVSYRSLPAGTARLYRLLSLIPGPDFGSELAAATAGLSPEQASELLDELTAASLLVETGQQRFRFHDLVKLHARDQVTAAERPAAIASAVGWYLAGAVAADIVVIPGRWRLNPMYEQARAAPPAFGTRQDALRWLESELHDLIAAIQTAHDEDLHEQAWQLCEAMWACSHTASTSATGSRRIVSA
jgi:hypothetical protein